MNLKIRRLKSCTFKKVLKSVYLACLILLLINCLFNKWSLPENIDVQNKFKLKEARFGFKNGLLIVFNSLASNFRQVISFCFTFVTYNIHLVI